MFEIINLQPEQERLSASHSGIKSKECAQIQIGDVETLLALSAPSNYYYYSQSKCMIVFALNVS